MNQVPVSNDEFPLDFEAIDRLFEDSDLEQCHDLQASIDPSEVAYEALRIKLALRDGSLLPAQALPQLIEIMRKHGEVPGARALHIATSESAYAQHASSTSMSHVPPPVKVAG